MDDFWFSFPDGSDNFVTQTQQGQVWQERPANQEGTGSRKTDAIVGTGQRRESYWKSIGEAYNQNRVNFLERSQKSLINRWDYINQQVSKFAGYIQQILHANRSGYTDADKTAEALALYAEMEGRQFTVSHCWKVLKNEAKWIDLQEKRTNHVEGQPRDPTG